MLKTTPPVDSAAATIEWSEDMAQLAASRPRTGRFVRESEHEPDLSRDVLER